MDELLRKHARRTDTSPCWAAWRVLHGVTADPDELRRWWREHGEQCSDCGRVVARVAGDHAGASEFFGLPRILRMAPSAGTDLAWAASSRRVLADPRDPLPLVTFRRLDSDLGTGLSSVWCVACDERLLLILCGDERDLARWDKGAQLKRADEESREVPFGPADRASHVAFCPRGTFCG